VPKFPVSLWFWAVYPAHFVCFSICEWNTALPCVRNTYLHLYLRLHDIMIMIMIVLSSRHQALRDLWGWGVGEAVLSTTSPPTTHRTKRFIQYLVRARTRSGWCVGRWKFGIASRGVGYLGTVCRSGVVTHILVDGNDMLAVS
jgi:hypothetical protein